MSICIMIMFCVMVAASWINAMPYIPNRRQIPRHSPMYIAMLETIDKPSMIPIERLRK